MAENSTKRPLKINDGIDRLLLVEGKDEVNFFEKMLEYLDIKNTQIMDAGGSKKFKEKYKIIVKDPNFKNVTHFGFVRDAEENSAKDAFNSIIDVFHSLEVFNNSLIRTPKTPGEISKFFHPISNQYKYKLGVFIMPDNQSPGMLEDLCLKSIEGNPLYACVEQYISCVKETDPQGQLEEQKARVQAYLAGKKPIVNSLGLGAQSGCWDFSHPAFQSIQTFLKDLFS
ncbi:MAG: hypothetical protein OEV94_00575 [Deltaproteobacteria bacterium]|nr:hypothetical protein [Deltaproteobacteria bacterium]